MSPADVLDQAATVVRRDDTTIYESYRGWSDRRSREPINAATRFQMASISKGFTAAAILLLVDERALSLHDPITRWLRRAPASWNPISIHHLLTHTSGLGHWPFYPELNLFEPIDAEQEVAIFQSHPLALAPGSRWAYSSPGYVVLAYLVHHVSGRPYHDFLRERLLRPLQLPDISAGNLPNPEQRPRYASGYADGVSTRPFELSTVGMGAGDLWSTARDLAAWMSSLRRASLLSPPLHAAMLAAQVPVDHAADASAMPATHYGYGFSLGEQGGKPVIFHTGHNPGFRSLAGLFPKTGVAFAYLSNEETTDLSKVMVQIIEVVRSIARSG